MGRDSEVTLEMTPAAARAWEKRKREILCEEIQKVLSARRVSVLRKVGQRMRKEARIFRSLKNGELSSLSEEEVLSTIRALAERLAK